MAMVAYEKVGNPIEAMMMLGKSIAGCGFFGCKTVEQGNVIALECIVRGIPPMLMAQQFHIVDGKLSMKADAMLAEFRRLGGKHKAISRTDELATIELSYDGETQRFSFSWEAAQLEPFVFDGARKEVLKAIKAKNTSKLDLNPNYASPRKRMQMLWSRVISDGVRTMMPEVNFGRYAPEELDEDGDEEGSIATTQAKVSTPRKTVADKLAEQAAAGATDTAVDAEFTPAIDKGVLITSIRALWEQLGADPADQQAMVSKERCGRPGAAALIGLDIEQLAELEGKLRAIAATQDAAVDAAAEVTARQEQTEDVPFDVNEAADGPISDVQLKAITDLVEVLGETNPAIVDNIGEQLNLLGKKLRELTAVQANVLIQDLKSGNTVVTAFKMHVAESLANPPHYATATGNA